MRIHTEENGSLVLALLAAVIIGGLITVVFATTVTGQRNVRFDRSFSNAIHAADAGVNAALTHVNTLEAGGQQAVGAAASGSDTLDGYDFDWTATKTTRTKWEVRATGESPDGTVRVLEASLQTNPLFAYSAFAKTQADLSGNNTSDSYDYTIPDADTGEGVIGTNGTIRIGNSSTASQVDGIELHDFHDDPDDPSDDDQDSIPARVDICANAECQPFHVLEENGGKIRGLFPKPLVFDDWWIEASFEQKQERRPGDSKPYPTGTPCTDMDTDADGPGWTITATATGTMIEPGIYCTSSLTITGPTDGKVDIRTNANGPADPDEVVIYTQGPINVAGQLRINCNSPDLPNCPTPVASNLQIYSIGPDVTIGQQTDFAALIYAPRANCTSPQSNAAVDIYGALVCQSLGNVGGWAFHFDESSREITTSEFAVTTWREEVAGTTSF